MAKTADSPRRPDDDLLAAANDPAIRVVRGILSGPSDAASEPPWPELPPGRAVEWDKFQSFVGPLEAHIVAGRLNADGVPTLVVDAGAILATGEISPS